ncbi:MAG: O-antigen ligase family protein [Elusimicrobiota bacterium]
MQILVLLFSAAALLFAGRFVVDFGLNQIIIFIIAAFTVIFAFFSTKSSMILLVFSMLLSPELQVGGVPGRGIVLRYDDIFLVTIFFAWLAKSAIFKQEGGFAKSPITKPLVLYTAIYILSTSFGVLRGDIDYKKSFFYVLKYVEYYMLYFMTLNILKDEKDISKYLKYAWAVLLIVIAYSYYYYFNASGMDIRASAPFEAPLNSPKESEPASLGGYYIIAFSLILALMSESFGKIFFFAAVTAVFMYQSLLYTFSRASYLGFAFSFVAFLLFSKKRKIFFITASILGIIFTLTLPGLSDKVENRIKNTYSGQDAIHPINTPFGEIKLEESAYLRYESLIRVINNVLPVYPILGRGVTGIGLGDNQYALILGETGILGMIAFIWLIFSLFKVFYFVYSKGDDIVSRSLGLGLFCALIGLLIQGIGVNTFIIVRIMEPFWFLTALVSLIYVRKKEFLNAQR